jgi:hypothetical protein
MINVLSYWCDVARHFSTKDEFEQDIASEFRSGLLTIRARPLAIAQILLSMTWPVPGAGALCAVVASSAASSPS